MNKLLQTHQALRSKLRSTVAMHRGRRVFNAVVIELCGADGLQVKRTITVMVGGRDEAERDWQRAGRVLQRLKALGFCELWRAMCHRLDGVGGTIRLRSPAWH